MFRHAYLMKNILHSNKAIRPPSLCPPILHTNVPSNSATHSVGLNLWVCVEQWCSSWCCSSSTPHNNFRYRHMHCMECYFIMGFRFYSVANLQCHSNQLTSWYLVKKHYNPPASNWHHTYMFMQYSSCFAIIRANVMLILIIWWSSIQKCKKV